MRVEPLLLTVVGLAFAACEPAPLPDEPGLDPAVRVPACTPDNDGIIEPGELAFVPGLAARYRVREGSFDFDTRGTIEDGLTTWDLSRPDPEAEAVARLGLEVLQGNWFASHFPGADLVAPLDARGDQLGVVTADDQGMHLHGFASRDEDPAEGRTLATYDAPITLTPLPLALGDARSESARASNAELLGLPTAFDDSYTVEVTAIGTMVLPDLILENTLRVTVRLERTLLAGDVVQVSHIWMHECLGEVARAVGPLRAAGVPYPTELDEVVELRRLSL